MNSGPVAQLRPMESRSACAMEAQKASGVLAGEHGAHGLDGARNHDRDVVAGFLHQALMPRAGRP